MSDISIRKTERGFTIGEFRDRYNQPCSIQESNIATEDCIWLGCEDIGLKRYIPDKGWENIHLENTANGVEHIANNRMLLNQEQAAMLIPLLQKFIDTGDFYDTTRD